MHACARTGPMHAATITAVVGILPFVALGLMNFGVTLEGVLDPCKTWGERWGSVQSGGGTSPGPAGCEAGTEWTTESRASALFRITWFPLGSLAALAIAAYGLERARRFPTAIAIAILLAVGMPLTISATILIAAVPALVLAAAARARGLAPTPPTVGVGIAAAAGALALLARTIPLLAAHGGGVAVIVGLMLPIELSGVALLCLWPSRSGSRATSGAAES